MRINKSQLKKIISEEIQKESAILARAIQRGLAPTKGPTTPPSPEEPSEQPEPEVDEAPDILSAIETADADEFDTLTALETPDLNNDLVSILNILKKNYVGNHEKLEQEFINFAKDLVKFTGKQINESITWAVVQSIIAKKDIKSNSAAFFERYPLVMGILRTIDKDSTDGKNILILLKKVFGEENKKQTEEPEIKKDKFLEIITSADENNFENILKKTKTEYASQAYDILEYAILEKIFKERYGKRFLHTTTVGSMNKTIEDISKLINDDKKNGTYWEKDKPFSTFIYDKIEEKEKEKKQLPISEDDWRTFLKTAFPNIFNNNGEEDWKYMNNFIDPMFDLIKQNYSEIVSPPVNEIKIYNRWKLIAGIK